MAFTSAKGVAVEDPVSLTPGEYPPVDMRATEHASVIAMAHAEQEAYIRFYRVSATAFRRYRRQGQGEFVLPSLEVVLTTGLLAGIIRRLTNLVPPGDEG
jgi:hypothetical protein